VEVDLLDYRELAGVHWPTRFFERVLRPPPIGVHQWRVTGLDVNRGFTAQDMLCAAFTGAAARTATILTGR
jgi:hypothetical protein